MPWMMPKSFTCLLDRRATRSMLVQEINEDGTVAPPPSLDSNENAPTSGKNENAPRPGGKGASAPSGGANKRPVVQKGFLNKAAKQDQSLIYPEGRSSEGTAPGELRGPDRARPWSKARNNTCSSPGAYSKLMSRCKVVDMSHLPPEEVGRRPGILPQPPRSRFLTVTQVNEAMRAHAGVPKEAPPVPQ
jgi:hypothetical protein